jgi:hypothetical protein
VLPSQRTIGAFVSPLLARYYYILVIGWVLLVFILVYPPVFGFDTLPLASAVIGAGPFVLYILHQKIVEQPRIAIEEDIYYDKYLWEYDETVYPIIEVLASVENIGNETAENCHVRVDLDGPESPPQGYYTRWTGEGYAPVVEFHPDLVKEFLVLQIVPTPETVADVADRLDDVEYNLGKEEIYGLPEASAPESTVSIDDGEYYVQCPLNHNQEAIQYESDDPDPAHKQRFIGKNLVADTDYSASVRLIADNWNAELSLEEIAIESAMENGKWYGVSEDYRPLCEAMETELNWANVHYEIQ